MSYSAKILLDSISESGKRLTTFEITLPRIVLSEFNTHRVFSRNSASSRAIPFLKQLSYVISEPFIPERFPINGKGMQPGGYYAKDSLEHELATRVWLQARDSMAQYAKVLTGQAPALLVDSGSDFVSDKEIYLNVHKQIANRLLEPFLWHKIICTATEWDNFFAQRTDENAQAEIKTIADLMYEAYHAFDNDTYSCFDNSDPDILKIEGEDWEAVRPQLLKLGEWHCPLIQDEDRKLIAERVVGDLIGDQEEYNIGYWITECTKRVSVARCARVSYLTHLGTRDIVEDLKLFEKLMTGMHWSPTEHVATPMNNSVQWSGNFQGWKQLRKEFSNENCTYFRKT